MLGPLIGGVFIFSATGEINRSNETVYLPYLLIGIVVAVLAAVFVFVRVPDLHAEGDGEGGTSIAEGSLWAHSHFIWAVVAQFCYVAAQTGVFSFFINYIVTDAPRLSKETAEFLPESWLFVEGNIVHLSERGASQLLAFGGFGLLLLGRLVGGILMRRIAAQAMLSWFGFAGVASMALVILPLGWVSVAALFLSFFFMSLMFPTIFALGIQGLGELTKKASSFMIMSIVGGAVMPITMGYLADHFSMRFSFAMPLVCFAVITGYALAWRRLFDGRRAA